MGKTSDIEVRRAVRWSLWLLSGVFFGVVVGFAFGLAKPRVPGTPSPDLGGGGSQP